MKTHLLLLALSTSLFLCGAAPQNAPYRASLEKLMDKSIDGLSIEDLPSAKLSRELLEVKQWAKRNRTPAPVARTHTQVKDEPAKRKYVETRRPLDSNNATEGWRKLRGMKYSGARLALRPVRDQDFLVDLGNKALQENNSCQAAEATLAIAYKVEELLPQEKPAEIILPLYESALRCNLGKLEENARFRAAMMALLQNDCGKALPHLDKLSDSESRLFAPRALYWQHECLTKANDTTKAAVVSMRLLTEQPFTFHALLMGESKSVDPSSMIGKEGPFVSLRTGRKDLDEEIRRIELLNRAGEKAMATRLLNGLIARTSAQKEALSEFRLYLAVLKYREKDFMRTFSLASEALRFDQTRLSRPLLKLLFPQPYKDKISRLAGPLEPLLITALMRQESSFDPLARSRAGARGLMQLLPSTLRMYSVSAVKKIHNPATNIQYGSKYFDSLLSRFDGKVEFALAAYNAGPGKVDQWLRRYPNADQRLFLDLIPFTETREYVSIIIRNYYWYRWLDDQMPAPSNVAKRAPAVEKRTLVSVLKSLSNSEIY